jgi:peptidoglycan/xylan/chitin deacetylase (PgdA/CDA1 family)
MLALHQRGLLRSYRLATMPLRAWKARAARRQGACPIAVLFYHRVADSEPNDWTIDVASFAKQIEWLSRRFDLLSLEAAQARLRSGRNDAPAVCITFDDGYRENCDAALPLLIERGIPCTYFVSWNHVSRGEPFPHDVARGKPLAPNTIEELRELARRGVEIGAHTRHHADLGKIDDPETLFDEVVAARDELAAALDRPVRYFAFPYGQHANLNRIAFRLAREAGYLGVCSAYGGYNFPGDFPDADPFHLQRIHADPEFARFLNWMTVDPRKIRSIRRFEDKEA